jgi:hypothetical protein
VVHRNDEGGLLGEYVEKYRAMAARGDRLMVDGTCYSACTLAPGIVDVCATPRASFGFHMAQSMTLFGLTPDLKILRGEELYQSAECLTR